MNCFDFYRAVESMVKERDPGLQHPAAADTLRHLRTNLLTASKVLDREIDLPAPSWDVNEFNQMLHCIVDIGSELIEIGALSKNERTQRAGWRTRSSSGHLRSLLVELGFQGLIKPVFSRIDGTRRSLEPTPARAMRSGAAEDGAS